VTDRPARGRLIKLTDLLRKRERAVADGVPITAKSTRLTFDDAVQDVVHDYVVNNKRSKGHLERRVRLHLAPVFSGRTLSSITTADVRAFAAKRLEAGAAHSEINRELEIVKRAFRLAIQSERYIGRLPHIPMLAEAAPRTGFFDDVMIAAVEQHLAATLRPVVRFAYLTGWRIKSEVLDDRTDKGPVRLTECLVMRRRTPRPSSAAPDNSVDRPDRPRHGEPARAAMEGEIGLGFVLGWSPLQRSLLPRFPQTGTFRADPDESG
jgi:hypothetical protein